MEIKFSSYLCCGSFICHNPNEWNLVYIENTGEKSRDIFFNYCKDSLIVHFDDVVTDILPNCIAPSKKIVQTILKWVDNKKSQSGGGKVYFTCPSGSTRSATLAYICNCLNIPAEEAIKIVNPEKHHLNKRIIKFASVLLEDPSIYEVYEKIFIEPLGELQYINGKFFNI